MKTDFVFDKVAVSWTKYDVVHVLDLLESRDSMQSYYLQEQPIDSNVLKAFLGIKDFSEPIPQFWNELFEYDLRIRKAFAFFLMTFSHYRVAKAFADYFIQSSFSGEYYIGNDLLGEKEQTNIRSLLVESGLASAKYRRSKVVPFDGLILLNETSTGPVFRAALENYIRRNSNVYDPSEFHEICETNRFYSVLGLTKELFFDWLDGKRIMPTHVCSISFDRFLCFDKPCELNFGDSKEVYIVGENGDGKTILLMAILSACKGYRMLNDADVGNIGEFVELSKRIKDCNLQAVDNLGRIYRLDNAPPFDNVFAYGVHRGRISAESDDKSYEKYGFMTLFSLDKTLRDPVDWLLKSALENQQREELSFDNLQKVLSGLLEEKIGIVREDSQIRFVEKGFKLNLLELSEGYRSTMIFVCDLLTKLSERTSDGENVFEQSGVVLIDEICLHLHPKWQRSIVGKLRKLFPNIQFIMTTHSPVILLGAGDDAVFYRVVREQGSTFVSDPYYCKDYKSMMLNTMITSSLFGLDSAAMKDSGDNIDTSDSYLASRIGVKVEQSLKKEREKGNTFFSDDYVDQLIERILKEELG